MGENKLFQNIQDLNASYSILIEVINAEQSFSREDPGESIK